MFVDDGSRDNTWAQIKDASTAYHYVRGIKLSRNKRTSNCVDGRGYARSIQT
ncbi:glycosyltransferase [Klebsiella pneumoniae]|nr:glycosyltransferase [Klebsiella pneumoniae]